MITKAERTRLTKEASEKMARMKWEREVGAAMDAICSAIVSPQGDFDAALLDLDRSMTAANEKLASSLATVAP